MFDVVLKIDVVCCDDMIVCLFDLLEMVSWCGVYFVLLIEYLVVFDCVLLVFGVMCWGGGYLICYL